MIKIQKNQSNSVPFTLNEKTTLTGSSLTYLLELYSNQNNTTKVLRLSGDTSSNPTRWNEYTIIETGGTESLGSAIVSLEAGTYDYYVWQTTASTLSLSAATSIVESGKCKVKGTGTTYTTFNNTTNPEGYTFE